MKNKKIKCDECGEPFNHDDIFHEYVVDSDELSLCGKCYRFGEQRSSFDISDELRKQQGLNKDYLTVIALLSFSAGLGFFNS